MEIPYDMRACLPSTTKEPLRQSVMTMFSEDVTMWKIGGNHASIDQWLQMINYDLVPMAFPCVLSKVTPTLDHGLNPRQRGV